jgi:hypothetical protein
MNIDKARSIERASVQKNSLGLFPTAMAKNKVARFCGMLLVAYC